MILRYENAGEYITCDGHMFNDKQNYYFANIEFSGDKWWFNVKQISKMDLNNVVANKVYKTIFSEPLKDGQGDYISKDVTVEIIKYETFDHKFVCIWNDLEADTTTNDGPYMYLYYNAITNTITYGELLNVYGDIKDINFKHIDDTISFNCVGVYDNNLYITEEETIHIDDNDYNNDLVINVIMIDELTNIVHSSVNDEDYKCEIQLNNLNTIFIKCGILLYGIIVNELSANIDNKIVATYIKHQTVLDIGLKSSTVQLPNGITAMYDFVCYDTLRLNQYSNNVEGYVVDYSNYVDGELLSYPVYKISIPLFEDDYSIDNLDAVSYTSNLYLANVIPEFEVGVDDDGKSVIQIKGDDESYKKDFTYNAGQARLWPHFIKSFYNKDLQFDLITIGGDVYSYSYIDKNVTRENINILKNTTLTNKYTPKITFVDNYVHIDISTHINIVKYVHILNENINNDVMFVNLIDWFPDEMKSNVWFKKVVDVCETVYNGGMKDLSSEHVNILFSNIGKYYVDDLKLYQLYSINLDAWFYDKRNMIFGDNIYKFIESLDKYKYMDEVPFEDIFTFAKSFGLDYLINESIFKSLTHTNNITTPSVNVNTIGTPERLDESFIRNSLNVLRLLSKYRGSVNFYDMLLNVMGFAVNVDLKTLNTNKSFNDSSNFESLVNDVTLELNFTYYNNKAPYIKDLLNYLVEIIKTTLYINRRFVGVTYYSEYSAINYIQCNAVEVQQCFEYTITED